MRISDWSSDVCSSDLLWSHISLVHQPQNAKFPILFQVADNEYLATLASYTALQQAKIPSDLFVFPNEEHVKRSEEHTSELQSLMRISYAVFCLKKKKKQNT